MPTKNRTQPDKKTPGKLRLYKPTGHDKPRLYTFEVFLSSGPITEQFAKKNLVVSRTIKMRGNQTLEELHDTTEFRISRLITAQDSGKLVLLAGTRLGPP